jgi:GNAT superfamily N-acetyltransferase
LLRWKYAVGLRKGLSLSSRLNITINFPFVSDGAGNGQYAKGKCLMSRFLPKEPNLDHFKHEAKAILKSHRDGDPSICNVLRQLHRFSDASDASILSEAVKLTEVQFAVSLDYGFQSWEQMKQVVSAFRLKSKLEAAKDYETFMELTGANEKSFTKKHYGEVRDFLDKTMGELKKREYLHSEPRDNGELLVVWKSSFEKGSWLEYILVRNLQEKPRITKMQLLHGPIERLPLVPNPKLNSDSKVSLKPILKKDISLLTGIAARAFSWDKETYGGMPDYATDQEKHSELIERGAYYSIRWNGRIIGAIGGAEWDEVSRAIGPLFIEPDLQRQGIGRMAIDILKTEYPQTPIWWLSAPNKSLRVHRFYEACEFGKDKEFEPGPLPEEVTEDFHPFHLYGLRTL